jgi:hypothetical protein
MIYENMTKKALVLAFRNKGGCWHTLTEAERIKKVLWPKLTENEAFALSVS